MSNNDENNKELSDLLRIEGVNSKGFGILPKLIMQDQRLTRDAKVIYGYFCSFAGAGDTAFPGVGKICTDLCFKTEETYRKHLSLLKRYNYIRVEQVRKKGKFARNIYILVTNPNPIDTQEVPIEDSPSLKISRTVQHIENTGFQPTLKKSRSVFSRSKNSGTKSNSIKNNNLKTTTDIKVVVEESVPDEILEEEPKEIKLQISDDEIQEVMKEIKDVIEAEIHHKIVKELLEQKGREKIKYYLANWVSLTQTQVINNVAGFFNKAVLDEYPIPAMQNKGPIAYGARAAQCGNFEQRQYDDEFYDNLYDNVKKIKMR